MLLYADEINNSPCVFHQTTKHHLFITLSKENKGVTTPAKAVLEDDCDKNDSLEEEEELAVIETNGNMNTHNLTFTKEEDEGLNESNRDFEGTG